VSITRQQAIEIAQKSVVAWTEFVESLAANGTARDAIEIAKHACAMMLVGNYVNIKEEGISPEDWLGDVFSEVTKVLQGKYGIQMKINFTVLRHDETRT
jgi:hypothetical protein